MNISFTKTSRRHIEQILDEDTKLGGKILELLHDIFMDRDTGKPERLKGNLSGWWSRRINQKHRLVYQKDEEFIHVARCYGHYEDK
ncbi:Txe/YoeB family addiction module toxin [Haliscomenobacter sp.]|jgi:toxin YoeB|uniref:Txe/YoeB family addiction module toxin n=1 Tax=Haliscomenobacter sp. TaxID=2717303 RepID=UPI003364F39B